METFVMLNSSDYTTHEVLDDFAGRNSDYSILWQTAVAFLLTVFILIAIIGNILVCIAIYTDRNLRHIGNTFTASLALADLLVGLVGTLYSQLYYYNIYSVEKWNA